MNGVYENFNVEYINYKGEKSIRKIKVLRIYSGYSDYYPSDNLQWLIDVYDYDKDDNRTFLLKNCNFLVSQRVRL